MGDSFKVDVPLETAVDAVVAGMDGLSTDVVERVAGAANGSLLSRGVNVPSSGGGIDSLSEVGREPHFNVGDHEGARHRAILKEQLVGTTRTGVDAHTVLFEGGASRNGVKQVTGINGFRRENGRELVRTITAAQFKKYARVALTDDVLNSVEAIALPVGPNRPLLFVPDVPVLPQDAELTYEEVIAFWETAAKYNGVELSVWTGRSDFLGQYIVEQLVNARVGELGEPGSISGVVIPTVYDRARAGTYQKQHDELLALQQEHDGVIDTRLYHGALLGCTDVNAPIDSDVSYVRSVGLDAKRVSPDSAMPDLFVPYANVYRE